MSVTGVRQVSRRTHLLTPAIALVLAMSACGGGGGEAGATNSAGSVEGKSVALISCGDFNRWCQVFNHGIMDDLRSNGADVTYLESQFDAAVQSQQVDQAISQNPDLIILYAADARALVPAMRRAQQRDIPIINVVSAPAPEGKPYITSSVEPGAVELGKNAGLNLIEGLKEAGVTEGNVVAVTGTAGTIEVPLRMQGFMSVMDQNPQYKVVETQDANWDPQKAAQISQQLFAKYRDKGGIQGAFGMSDDLANAIIQTAKQAGVTVGAANKGLVVVSSNCYKVGIDNIEAGDQYGTSTESPGRYSEFVQKWVNEYLTKGSIEKEIIQEEVRITRANVGEWKDTCSVI
ncbi:sugar ABC transporter substrate-binding protein [uncultured Arthrobacter sp.]|uniref:sugar ABC transporter substrate-binding protein n=1 Tax=uncultured Arthrobacter sp. TaxID=114050 RepID=UPI0025D7F720|nr:sugar ABC transporter substrate-binding protein [uncultured Arthrobacter sp.]